jgi:hypothetical protein
MAKRGKRKPPQIVPKFLKNAVVVGAIPALVGCTKPPRQQPVVANYTQPQPVVAAYQPPPPVVAAYVEDSAPARAVDAGVDAPAAKKKVDPKKPPPPVVAMMIKGNGADLDVQPAVVAAYVPRDPEPGLGGGSAQKPKKPTKKP